MARYEHEFMGIPARIRYDRGMDPNFRGGYRGMRMRGTEWQGAYGRHRLHHAADLGTQGGFFGRGQRGEHPSLRDLPERGPDGGARERYDRGLLRQYNAASPRLRRERGDAEQAGERALQRPENAPRQRRGNRFGYTNRGLSGGGYSEGWTGGPMRGAPNRAPDRAR